MHAVQVTRWAVVLVTTFVVLAVVVAMGYGLIGLPLLLLAGGLVGGALLSFLGGDD